MTSKFAIATGCCCCPARRIPPRSRCCPPRPPSEAYKELVPQFEKATGHKVTTVFTGTLDADKRLAAGETYDHAHHVERLDRRAHQGRQGRGRLAASISPNRASRVGVKAGAPKPDISSVEALKKTILAAKSIGYSTGPSGIYIISLFEKLGVADAVEAQAQADPDRRVRRQHHRQRRSRDRLPAGQRAVALCRRRLRRPAARSGAALHRVLQRHRRRGQGGRRRQGAGEIPHALRPPRQAFKKQGMEPG